jgi:hypothetical protein
MDESSRPGYLKVYPRSKRKRGALQFVTLSASQRYGGGIVRPNDEKALVLIATKRANIQEPAIIKSCPIFIFRKPACAKKS